MSSGHCGTVEVQPVPCLTSLETLSLLPTLSLGSSLIFQAKLEPFQDRPPLPSLGEL